MQNSAPPDVSWPAYADLARLAACLHLDEAKVVELAERRSIPTGRVHGGIRLWSTAAVRSSLDSNVYFIEASNLIKVGWSGDVRRRVKSLLDGLPCAGRLLGTSRGPKEFEAYLHKRFHSLRSHREWFRRGPELLAYIEYLRGEDL